MASKTISETINEKSDSYLVKQFYNEFCQVIQDQIKAHNKIYFVEVLDKLHFIDEMQLIYSSEKMNALMEKTKASLVLDTMDEASKDVNEDVIKNLFKVCCAILNIKPKQRGRNPLENSVLKSCLF
jgi:ribosomal protein L23